MAGTPGAKNCFVLIIQGSQPWAGVVDGIEGVKESFVRIFRNDPDQMLLLDVAAAIASLDTPEAWAMHGAGDGRPYWHWWFGYEGGSVTVQRLTKPLPPNPAVHRLRSRLDEVAGALTDITEDLRSLTDVEQRQYVFTRRQTG